MSDMDPREGLPDLDALRKLNPTDPIPAHLLAAEEREKDVLAFQRAVEGGRRPQDQSYAGQMPNVPAFEVAPWKARPETDHGIGVYCPSHLHVFTDQEKEPSHYPRAALDENGELARFCWACGRPCQENGLSGKGHRGIGKPCPACGFRRKSASNRARDEQLRPAQPRHKGLAPGAEVAKAVRDNSGNGDTPGEVYGPRGGLKRGATVSDLIRDRTEARRDAVVRPYFNALELEAREDWSPSTKLAFYMNQTQIAEKLLNRVEGMPVARTRHVTKEDEDVLRDDELSPSTLVQLVAAMATGADVDTLLVVDAEYSEVTDTEAA